MTGVIVVLVTAKDEDEAARIGKALVARKLAACCSIIPGARSIYFWDGAVQDEREAVMVIKALAGGFPALEAEIRRLHSYQTPEIIALPVTSASKDYLDWVSAGCQGPAL